jgi:photosystem II stability/assembly factor-like uncharacterized protein
MLARVFSILLYLGIANLAQAQETWQWRNGFPQGHNLHGVHFLDAATGLAVGLGGTILRTVDSGNAWSILASGVKTGLTALHFPSPDTGYVAGWDGTVLRTSDAGRTWSQCSTGTDKNLWDIHFVTPNTGYAVGDEGVVIQTENGGLSWNARPINAPYSLLSAQFISEDTGFVAGGGGTLLKTVNGGRDWAVLRSSGEGDIRSLYFPNSSTGCAVGSVGVLGTRNGGASWDTLSPRGATLESVECRNPDSVNAVGAGGTAIRSLNGGRLWQTQNAAIGPNVVQAPTTHWDLYDLHFPDSRNGYAVGQHGIITVTRDGGASWSPLSRSASVVQMNGVTFLNRDTGFVTGTEGFVLRTVDGGNTWARESTGTNTDMHVIQFPTSRIGYVVGHFGELLKTADGGKTWNCQLGANSNSTCLDTVIRDDFNGISFPNGPDTGYAVASGGHILKTVNGGLVWTPQNSGTAQRFMYVQCLDARTCIAVGDIGTVLKTSDGGAHWTSRAGCRTQNLNAVHFPVPDTGYIVGAQGTICKSEDGGETWSARPSGTNAELRAVRFLDARFGYAVGTGGTILLTRDGGNSWQSLESGTLIDLQTIFVNENSAVIAGNAGVILKAEWGIPNAVRQRPHSQMRRPLNKGHGPHIIRWDQAAGVWVDVKGRTLHRTAPIRP